MTVENVEFLAEGAPAPMTIPARLRICDGAARRPAVVIAHGSSGPDSRGAAAAAALAEAGVSSLENDMWAARGL